MAKETRLGRLLWISVAAAAIWATCMYFEHTMSVIGVGRTYANVNTTSCRQLGHGVLRGCEDIVVDPHSGLAYLACGDLVARRRWLIPDEAYDPKSEAGVDRVYVMDENDVYAEIRLLERAADGELAPFRQSMRMHGFDIYWDPEDPRRMTFMLVNHQPEYAAVSIFSYTSGADYMVHEETVWSGLLWSPNNIIATSRRSFYATNDQRHERGLMRTLSAYLRVPDGHIVHRNESGSFSIAASHIRYPNGIARHKDRIYVASSTDPGVRIYTARPDGRLEYMGRTVYRDSIPDNLFVDPLSGQVYSTSFVKMQETQKYFCKPSLETTRTAGTKILRLTPRDDPRRGFDVETLMVDGGELMPSATVAVVQRRNQIQRLLVGCVACNAVVVCDA